MLGVERYTCDIWSQIALLISLDIKGKSVVVSLEVNLAEFLSKFP